MTPEMTEAELERVNGGLLPLLAAAAAEVGMGIVEGAVAVGVAVAAVKIYEAASGNTVRIPGIGPIQVALIWWSRARLLGARNRMR